MPHIALSVTGDPARDLAAVLAQVAASALAGVSEAADKLRTRLSEQVVIAGLGQRLADSWRTKPSRPNQTTVSAEVASSAPLILSAFDQGVTITARNGRWLAIPTNDAPRGPRRRMTPAQVEARFGRRLRFIPARLGRTAVLVMAGKVMFVLVPQVTLQKRLDIAGAVAVIEN